MGYEFGWRSKGLLCASLPFSLGSLLYYYKSSFPKLGAGKLSVKLGAIIGYVVISLGSYVILDMAGPNVADFLFDISIVPSAFALAVLYPKLEKDSPNLRKIDNYLGGRSYPYYVLHWLVTIWVIYLLGSDSELGLTKSGIICFAVVLVVMTVVGLLFEGFVEPRVRRLRKLLR